MRENIGFVLTTCVLALLALAHLHETYYDASLIDALVDIVGICIAVILFIVALSRILKYKGNLVVKQLLPLCLWTGCAAIVAIYFYWLKRIESAPNFLQAGSGNNLGFDELTLKKDGRYVYSETFLLGQSHNFGTYTRHDSIINLTPDCPRNAPKQCEFRIRPYYISSTPAFNNKSIVLAINPGGKPRSFDSGYQGYQIWELAHD